MRPMEYTCGAVTDPAVTSRERSHAAFIRRAAAECIVLVKNEGMLPLEPGSRTAVFGSGSVCTIKGGTGSGDVNNRHSVSLYEGLQAAGVPIVNRDWNLDYTQRYREARLQWKQRVLKAAEGKENVFDAYAANPFVMPDGRAVLDRDTAEADCILYVISRISGEGRDRDPEEGDYRLSRKEREDLRILDRTGKPVALIVNTGGVVELAEILEECTSIRAVLITSMLGQEGGHAMADVITGRVSPSGRLTATWPMHYEDVPAGENFGRLNGDLSMDEYREGIFVGYRGFNTYGILPLFPFGCGLSYTEFCRDLREIRSEEGCLRVRVAVTNTGDRYAGRDVVQLYMILPQDGERCEWKRLVAFGKTKELAPGETEELSLTIPQKNLASFRETDHCWVIRGGSYILCVGEDSWDPTVAALVQVEETEIIEKTGVLTPPDREFQEIPAPGGMEQRWRNVLSRARAAELPVCGYDPMEEMAYFPEEAPAAEEPVEDLLNLFYGNPSGKTGFMGVAGTRVHGSAGETTTTLWEDYGIPSVIMADGPAGLRLKQYYDVDPGTGELCDKDFLVNFENGFLSSFVPPEDAVRYYQYCSAFPVGTAFAQSWNTDLAEEFGRCMAVEMEEFGVQIWLAPGMNIQRNPLCGRNYEYYSEDPLLSGRIAAGVTRGVQSSPRCAVTLKHFVCNNQEDNRMAVNARVHERALREIYLRGFEIAVKESSPRAVMTSYNLVNGVHTANAGDLMNQTARGEWGFSGIFLSDWFTTMGEGGSIPWVCISSGNDLINPGMREDAENIQAAWQRGDLSEDVIRRSAGRLIRLIRRLTEGR